jgi:hypothetical protein
MQAVGRGLARFAALGYDVGHARGLRPSGGPLIASRFFGGCMRPVSRSPVNKSRSAKQFRGQAMRTMGRNMQPAPQRGGYRL